MLRKILLTAGLWAELLTVSSGQENYQQHMRLGQWKTAYSQWITQYRQQPCPPARFFQDGVVLLDTLIRKTLRNGSYPQEMIDTLLAVFERAQHCHPPLKDSFRLQALAYYWEYKIVAGVEHRRVPPDSVLRAYERLGTLAQQNHQYSPLIEIIKATADKSEEAWTLIREWNYFVRQWFQLKNTEGALPHWRVVFKEAPCGSSLVLSAGADIFAELIQQADAEIKQRYADTLMLIYDTWLKCFPEDSATALPYKLYYAYSFRWFDSVEELYKLASATIRLKGNNTEHFVLPVYLYAAVALHKKEALPAQEVLTAYQTALSIARKNIPTPHGNYYRQVEEQLNEMLAKSNIIKDCSQLDKLFGNIRSLGTTDTGLLATVYRLGDALNCRTEFFTWVAEQMWQVTHSADVAIELSNLYHYYNKCDKAIEIATEGANLATDSSTKARLLYFAAGVASSCLKNFPQARELARKAIQWAPHWGEPYILIGDLYASSSMMCQREGTLDHKAVFWLAIDYYYHAMRVDNSVKEKVEERIAKYKKYTPTREDAHFYLLKEGKTYTVGCWIQENTTVRFYE